MPPVSSQIQIIKRGSIDLISEEELSQKLELAAKKKRPLRVKYGADPSAPDIHLGHTVPLRKLREIQDLGHLVVFIIGDFTARIGDPSGANETRKPLSPDEIRKNAETYQDQVFKILDKNRTEVRFNSEWLERMTPSDFLELTRQYTVARLLERDDFQKRFQAKRPIALLEFLYPLLQGYDSVMMDADLELGGTDQKFNFLVGRELQKAYGKPSQVVLTLPIIEGTDGVQKMSKSLGNYIALTDDADEMFGKIMSIPDALMERYAQYLTGWDEETIDKNRRLHPKAFKVELGKRMVTLYHSQKEAEASAQAFDRLFKEKQIPDDIPVHRILGNSKDLVTLLCELKLVSSRSEARRMIEQGGVKINQVKVTNVNETVAFGSGDIVLQCGKRKFAKVMKA